MALGVLTLLPGAEPRAGRPVALLPMHYTGELHHRAGVWCAVDVVEVRDSTIQRVIRATHPSGPARMARPDPRCPGMRSGAARPHRRRQEDPRVLVALGREWEYMGSLGSMRVYRRFRTLAGRPGTARPVIDLGPVRLVPDASRARSR
jgi:hypothetical protein